MMSPVLDAGAERDLRALDLGAYCRELQDLRLDPASIRTQNSIIVRGVKPDTGEQFAVKRARSPARASLEFETLSRLAQALPEEAAVARPVCLVAEHAVLVAEWIDGRSVHALLVDRKTTIRSAGAALAASGRWLRDFHAVGMRQQAPLELGKKLAQLEELCAALAGRGLRYRVMRALQRRLVAAAPALADRALPQSELHGDFKPENLLIRGERAVGIDVGHLYRSCVYNDVGYFLAQLEWAVLSRPNLRLAVRLGVLRRAFLDGYGAPPADRDVLAWIQREVLFRLAYKHLCRARLGAQGIGAVALLLALFARHGFPRPRKGSEPG